ncbi:MAG TPA: FAD-dependent oxidoreductase, partial [Candidatus Limnocylindrales bacterium]|nr:FAD-dependent oxidoreductase [Candidatus Limnocylindrales bacterium]
MPMAIRDLVEEWFRSDSLRALVAARGVLLTGLGPRMPGTTGVLLTDAAGADGGLAGQTVYARGGPGAVAEALAAAARASGVEIRGGVGVQRVKRLGEAATGVILDGGEEIDAAVVVSSLDPRTTLLTLLEPEVLGPRLSWRASNIRQRGVTAKVNYALAGLPVFPGSDKDTRQLRGRIVLAPSMVALERATDPAKYGAQAEEPLIEATIPTLVDPSLIDAAHAPAVRHVLSAVVQAAVDESIGDVATRTLEAYAPGFADLIVERQVFTPGDIEGEWGAAGGHPMHAEVGLDQWLEWRPVHGFGRYRMPLRGMYLAGAGAHPGGGITGMPGYLAAQAVLEDRGNRPR